MVGGVGGNLKYATGSTSGDSKIVVTGLDFKPICVFIVKGSGSYMSFGGIAYNPEGVKVAAGFAQSNELYDVDTFISEDGFSFNVGNGTYTWYAYGK